ncbi:MAG: DUF1295 domain-containing protein [Alphaproteobacteria bacterium]
MATQILMVLGLAFLPFFALWGVSIAVKDASIVDIFWGPSFVVTAFIAWVLASNPNAVSVTVLALVTLWGLRLGIYLFRRNHGSAEDWRYQKMRANHPDNFAVWSFYGVFGLQWAVMAVVSLPVVATLLSGGVFNALTFMGIAIFATGLAFEANGDWQLSRFKADPANAGKVMNKGLWAWTRHPNYFGDATVWWGLGVIALGAGHWWALIGPMVMTFFLINISGKAMLERKLAQTREGYEAYLQNTSGFFPLPPK